MGQKRIQLVVRGRVQGVFYRATAQREARQLGLTGWVKNRGDGTVEMVVEGDEDAVKDFLAWAQQGPATARVDKVETKWRSYTGEFSDFRIAKRRQSRHDRARPSTRGLAAQRRHGNGWKWHAIVSEMRRGRHA